MSMTKLENSIWMTIDEAYEKFYPNSYLMINCELDMGAVVSGEVVAYAPLKQKKPLVHYGWELSRSGEFGWVVTQDTKDPLDGGSLLVEYMSVEQ